jgi:predicted esterase
MTPVAILSILLAGLLGAPETPAGAMPRGEVVPKVVCASDAEQSYALYLPKSFSMDRTWPILYLHDPRRHGAQAVELFREPAEKYGWILAGSNNTESDGPMSPNIKAMVAMWDDTHRTLPIDPRRVYATGFSGGARASCLLAQKTGKVAGVIGCGAGFAEGNPPEKNLPFVYFGAVGDKDFNYLEMRELDATLAKLKATHRLAVFDGPHRWPPADVCLRAVEWMEREAMRAGLRPRDEALLAACLDSEAKAAAAIEAAGKKGEALERYRGIAVDNDGLTDLSAVKPALDRLEKDADARHAVEKQVKLEADERRTAEEAGGKLLAALQSDEPIPAKRLAQDLHIPQLRHAAEAAGTEAERLSARRILVGLVVQTSFYLPRDYVAKHDARRARLCIDLAEEAEPDRAGLVWYNFACIQATSGDRKSALASLQTAVDKGFHDADLMDKDPDLDGLRGDEAFRKLVDGIRKPA